MIDIKDEKNSDGRNFWWKVGITFFLGLISIFTIVSWADIREYHSKLKFYLFLSKDDKLGRRLVDKMKYIEIKRNILGIFNSKTVKYKKILYNFFNNRFIYSALADEPHLEEPHAWGRGKLEVKKAIIRARGEKPNAKNCIPTADIEILRFTYETWEENANSPNDDKNVVILSTDKDFRDYHKIFCKLEKNSLKQDKMNYAFLATPGTVSVNPNGVYLIDTNIFIAYAEDSGRVHDQIKAFFTQCVEHPNLKLYTMKSVLNELP